MTRMHEWILALGILLSGTATTAAPPKPIGTWKRAIPPAVTTNLTFTDSEITATITYGDLQFKLEGYYNITPNGTIYGMMTSAQSEIPEVDASLQALCRQPFAMHYRATDSTLTLQEFKLGWSDWAALKDAKGLTQFLTQAEGDYQSVQPKPTDIHTRPTTPQPVQHALPALVPDTLPALPPVASAPIPSQILAQWELDTGKKAGTPAPVVVSSAVAPTALTPSFATIAPVVPLASAPVTPAKTSPVGKWVREMAGFRTILTITDRRLQATVEFRHEALQGRVYLDADLSVSDDGRVFGIVNSIDITMPDDDETMDSDAINMAMKELSAFKQSMFHFRVRNDGTMMTIRDLTLMTDAKMDDDMRTAFTTYFGGRYQQANEPSGKPVKTINPAAKPGRCEGTCPTTIPLLTRP